MKVSLGARTATVYGCTIDPVPRSQFHRLQWSDRSCRFEQRMGQSGVSRLLVFQRGATIIAGHSGCEEGGEDYSHRFPSRIARLEALRTRPGCPEAKRTGCVPRGRVRDQNGAVAVLQEMVSSPACIGARHFVDAYGLLTSPDGEAHVIQQADAEQAYTQAYLNTLHETWIRVPKHKIFARVGKRITCHAITEGLVRAPTGWSIFGNGACIQHPLHPTLSQSVPVEGGGRSISIWDIRCL